MESWQIEWTGMLAVLARIGAAVSVSPPFASIAVPRRVRAMFAIALTVAMAHHFPAAFPGGAALALAIAFEVLIGLAIGLSIALVFLAAGWAGDLVAGQLGLNLSETYDPGGASEGTPLGQAWRLLAVVVFLAVDGHHVLIRGLFASFDVAPALHAANARAATDAFVAMLQAVTMLSVRLAAPVFIATLIADVAIGLAGRTIPQLCALTAGVTVRSVIGLCILIAGISVTVAVLQSATLKWVPMVNDALRGLSE